MNGRRITISGKRYWLRYVPLRRNDGDCDAPHVKRKEIRIAIQLRRHTAALAETLAHEIIHASVWSLAEETVEQLASDLVRIMKQEGLLRD